MKKILFILLLIPVISQAQTTHYVQWDPNPTSDLVQYYTLVFDTSTAQSVPAVIDSTCSCIQAQIAISTGGSHTVSVTATNQWGTSSPTVVTFNSNPAGKVANVRIK